MTTDATQVTGGPAGTAGLQPGAVLAERYELLEVLDREGPSIGFRALDQETERPVLLRVLSGNVRSKVRDEMVERLRGLIGVGGRFLSSLLDADHEGAAPFTVEAWPTGTQLTGILDSRRARGEPLGPRELLPVVGRLAAALDAIPRHWVHGDVRPERVWLDTDGLRLTGPFLLVALPKGVLVDHMGQLGPGEVAYPPDLRQGTPSGSSDRWGVAAIAWEALTGRSADEAGVAAGESEVPPGLRGPLTALLSTDPTKRPRDLTALIAALAGEAKLPVPQLDPEPHAPPTADIGRPPGTPALRVPKAPRRKLSDEGTVRVASKSVGIAGAAPDGTQEIAFDQIIEDRPADSLDPHLVRMALAEKKAAESADEAADETAKHRSVSVSDADAVLDSSSLDPRLMRAALAEQASREVPDSGDSIDPALVQAAMAAEDADQTMPGNVSAPAPGTATHNDSLDPRLVRAALGVAMDSESENLASQELDIESEDLELLDAPTQRASAKSAAKITAPGPKRVASRPPGAKPRSAIENPKRPPGPKPRPSRKGVASRPPGAGPKPRAASPAPKPRPAKSPTPAHSAPRPKPAQSAPKPGAPAGTPAPKPRSSNSVAPAPLPRAPGPQPQPSAPAARSTAEPMAAHAAPEPAHAPQTEPDRPLPKAKPAQAVTAVVPNPTKRGRTDDTPPAIRRTRGEAPKKSNAGVMIVAGALLLAIVIVAVGFVIASQRRSDAARAREIQERLQQIRSEETP